jgi:hypothetical protein
VSVLSPVNVPPLTFDQRAMVEYGAALISAGLVEAVQAVRAAPSYDIAGGQTFDAGMPAPYQQLIGIPSGTGTSAAVYEVAGTLALWPLSVICRLTTSATVATRTVALEYRDGDGLRYLVAGTQAGVDASGAQTFCWHPQAGEVAWPIDDAALAPLPQQHLYPGQQLAIRVVNGQSGDVLDSCRLSARFDPMPARVDE